MDLSARRKNPAITAKIGARYEDLVRAAQPTPEEFQKQFGAWFDWLEGRWQFSKPYELRWRKARLSQADLRWHGKVRCKLDITYAQAAKREQDDALIEAIDKAGSRERRQIAPATAGLTWLEWQLFIRKYAVRRPRTSSSRQYHALLLGRKKPGRPGRPCNLTELLSNEAIERSKANDARRPRRQHAVFLDDREELELARKAKAGDIIATNRIIVAHLPVAKRIASKYAADWDKDDLFQEGIIGLSKALTAFDPESGVRFGAFAQRSVEWAILDFLRKQRRQSALSLDAMITPDNPKSETWLDQLVDFNPSGFVDGPALPTLDGLSDRERHVIEARYGLNGKDRTTLKAIGKEFGISDERVRQIETRAIAKLKKIAHPRSTEQ